MSSPQRNQLQPAEPPMRKSVLIVATLCAVAAVAAVIVYGKRDGDTRPSDAAAVAEAPRPTAPQPPASPEPTDAAETSNTPLPPPAPSAVLAALPAKAPVPPAVPRPEPTAYTRDLVTGLSKIDLSRGEVTAEQAAAWKQSLQQLTQRGAEAVPALREFLEKNLDLSFEAAKGGGALGQPSLRLSLLDALQQIGGPEAMALTLDTLRSSSEPREIAWLAQALEKQAPEQYRAEAVNAAREALAQAAAGKLEGRDVGPLFGVLQQFGGAEAVPDLEKARGAWRYYASIALAEMPNGQGVPALIQMARDTSASNSRLGLQMLAQVAPQYPEARTALFEHLRTAQLPDATWMTIADVLGGDRYQIGHQATDTAAVPTGGLKTFHLNYGNQNFYSVMDTRGWTDDQVNQRVQLIDQLLNATATPAAVDALKKSRERLLTRPRP